MTNHVIETRAINLVDIPTVRRLTDSGAVLDSELGFTRDVNGPNSALLTSFLLPQRHLYTLIARSDGQQVVGQFRIESHTNNAQIVYIAPDLPHDVENTEWLHLLDAMAIEAGKRGAHAMIAEVDENSPLFSAMRTAGFAVYSRQEIWQHLPDDKLQAEPVELHEQCEADETSILSLYDSIVPGLMQQLYLSPLREHGFVYRKDGRIEGYITLVEGRHGIYLTPYLHPDVYRETPGVIVTAIEQVNRSRRVPVYIRLRRYQSWLEDPLYQLGLRPIAQEAVMVRHLALRLRQAAPVRAVRRTLEVLPKQALPTPTPALDRAISPLDAQQPSSSKKQE